MWTDQQCEEIIRYHRDMHAEMDRARGIDQGDMKIPTEEELVSPEYLELVQQLELSWSPEKLKQYVLDYLRGSCKWASDRQKGIEEENFEARRRGVPYAERQAYTVQIKALEGLYKDWRDRGVMYSKRNNLRVADFFPPRDLFFVQEVGFETQLQYRLVYG